ncbi:hypothetical protein BS47DRAFT_397773 [Hydnum rufescens UP504]|uniref:Uncharacterized protein n=1 Tax=Hydnum rufescens UP504 TaxID=1448309 RepID=A0A9P6BDB3_9AGAM|nr:hypothetical protein BS47DRAFT_397773 [Hydnum rufescens UP504]
MPSGSKWSFGEFDVSDDSSGSRCAELDDDDDLLREDEPQEDAGLAASADLHMLLNSQETKDDTSPFPHDALNGNHITSPQSSPPQLSPELPSPAHPVFLESNLPHMDQQTDLYDPYGFGAPGDYGPDDLEALLRQHEVGSLVSSSLEEEQEVRGILD